MLTTLKDTNEHNFSGGLLVDDIAALTKQKQ
ncbi:CLUMA_CG006548, isoform A [Clunio marinus]|uniref:CLUMA_CG006548, isoform A n=1 Tax=Clunio marinus TaxID=568069 RepID=A0A1J1HXW8_9DIPT|nr:CLUMA_CG006548, isoform A [Clunio marinus]